MLAALTVLTGCSDEEPFIPRADSPGLPFPDTPDKLMFNFRTIYETMDYDSFRGLLAPEFITILQEPTIFRYPDLGSTLDVTEEQRIHGRMFAGQPVTDPAGAVVPGVETIEFVVFDPVAEWMPTQPGDPISGAEWRTYNVVILLDCGRSEYTLDAHGQIRFYVTHRDSTVNGETIPYYQMVGQMDQTLDQFGKGTESSAWGTIKARFR